MKANDVIKFVQELCCLRKPYCLRISSELNLNLQKVGTLRSHPSSILVYVLLDLSRPTGNLSLSFDH